MHSGKCKSGISFNCLVIPIIRDHCNYSEPYDSVFKVRGGQKWVHRKGAKELLSVIWKDCRITLCSS